MEEDAKGNWNKSKPTPKITAKKIEYAVKAVKNKPIALTFIHQPECTTWNTNTMSGWMKESELKPLIDEYTINYLLISYYEDNCDKGEKTSAPKSKLTKEEKEKLSDSAKRKEGETFIGLILSMTLKNSFQK